MNSERTVSVAYAFGLIMSYCALFSTRQAVPQRSVHWQAMICRRRDCGSAPPAARRPPSVQLQVASSAARQPEPWASTGASPSSRSHAEPAGQFVFQP